MTTAAPETRIVETASFACDGGEGALGHPRIWLRIPEERGWIECPYCDARFVLAGHGADHDAGKAAEDDSRAA